MARGARSEERRAGLGPSCLNGLGNIRDGVENAKILIPHIAVEGHELTNGELGFSHLRR